jgi:hypothetical protein
MHFEPIPLNSHPEIIVPRLEIIPYDFQGLSEFSERCGVSQQQLCDASQKPRLIASIVQSWLWFGLLSEYLQASLRLDEFSYFPRGNKNQPQITLEPVRQLLEEVPQQNADEDELTRRRLLLENAVSWLRSIEDGPLHTPSNSHLAETTLSVRMLMYMLGTHNGGAEQLLSFSLHPLISKTLKDRGWCPSHINDIELYDLDTLGYYLACMRRPNPRGFSHRQCPETNCEATSTKLAGGYIIRHTHEDTDSCPMIQIDERKVRSIIAAGGIPLVSITTSNNNGLQFQVRAGRRKDPYVAISHVWADGLGNPWSNALPTCQVSRMATFLTNLPSPSFRDPETTFRKRYELGPASIDLERLSLQYRPLGTPISFWMDTLCIPVSTDPGDEEVKELKKRAIDQMADIYGRATQVLVLDSGLQELKISAMQDIEILAQIIFSSWMGRSWTLQEGALSAYVYFQFADGALNFFDMPRPYDYRSFLPLHPSKFRHMNLADDLGSIQWALKEKFCGKAFSNTSKATEECTEFLYGILHNKLIASLHSKAHTYATNYRMGTIPPWEKDDAKWVSRLVDVWNCLVIRTTTMAEDLPAILANLLEVNTYEVLSLPSEKRLSAILGTGSLLPLPLLWNRGPRLHPDGDHYGRWIPTLLGRQTLVEAPIMRPDANGNMHFRFSDIRDNLRPDFLLLRTKLHIPGEIIYTEAEGELFWRIRFYRYENDQLNYDEYHYTGFIFYKRDNIGMSNSGCCLRLRPTSDTKNTFEALYDCPIMATRIPQPNLDPLPHPAHVSRYDVEKLSSEWYVTLLSDRREQYQLPVVTSRRPKMGRRRRIEKRITPIEHKVMHKLDDVTSMEWLTQMFASKSTTKF